MRGDGTKKDSRWLRFGGVLALAALLAYMLGSAVVAYSVWHPVRKALHTTPAEYGLAYEGVEFRSTVDAIPLRGWFIESPGARCVLVLHGSNSTKDNYITMEVSNALVQRGFDVFTFDFRGHGESGGAVGSLGALEVRDVDGALDYLRGRGITEVGALGHSMGAAAALLAAPEHPEMRAIVADSSFAELYTILDRERAKSGIPLLFNPGVLLVSRLQYGIDPMENQPKDALARLSDRPVLLIHSAVDDLIPPSEAYELQKAGAGNPNLDLWVAPGSGHVAAFGENKAEYVNRVVAFFDKYMPGR
jgi:alpha-beta hydrolase superfamily lysophospholipase